MSWFSVNLSLIYLQPLPHLYKSPPSMFQYICYSAQFVFLKKFLLKPPELFQFRQVVNLYMCCTTVILRSLFIIIINSHCCLLESEPSFFVIICISLDSLSHFSGDIFQEVPLYFSVQAIMGINFAKISMSENALQLFHRFSRYKRQDFKHFQSF